MSVRALRGAWGMLACWSLVGLAGCAPEAVPQAPAEPAAELVERLKPMLSRSHDGLVIERRPDGTGHVELGGRFTHISLARRAADGSLTATCVDSVEALEAALDEEP